jgi:hypothetical protein
MKRVGVVSGNEWAAPSDVAPPAKTVDDPRILLRNAADRSIPTRLPQKLRQLLEVSRLRGHEGSLVARPFSHVRLQGINLYETRYHSIDDGTKNGHIPSELNHGGQLGLTETHWLHDEVTHGQGEAD